MLKIYFYSILFIGSICLLFPQFSFSQNGLNFDGSNDYVQTPYPGILGSANRTFEAWVNVSASATANTAILDYGLNAVGSRNTFLVNPNNQLAFISGGINANISTSLNAVPSGVWTHVAFVLDNGTGYLYVNGVLLGTGSLTTVNTPAGNANMTIGQRVAGGSIPFLGAIDEVRVWNYARTQIEIQNDMNAELCTIPVGLEAYYQFNEGMAGGTNTGITNLPDLSGNAYNGTLTNFALSGASSNWVTGATLGSGSTNTILNESTCVSYTSPSGNYTWTASGTYMDTIQTGSGCDSTFTVNLTILGPTNTILNEATCVSYTSPSGNYIWTSSGIYMDTIQTANGCDSTFTVNLLIFDNTYDTLTVSSCDSYQSPSGNQIWVISGAYQDTLPNTGGCDSVITVNLTIANSNFNSISIQECDSVVSPSGNYTWATSGTYADTLTNASGCDSLLEINVTILASTSETFATNSCGPFSSPSGKYTWDATGTYLDTVMNIDGCNHYLTIDLSIIEIDTVVNQTDNTLSVNTLGDSYQWLDCNNAFAPISGETGSDFLPTNPGSYAVAITQNGCIDTSGCHTVDVGSWIEQVGFSTPIKFFPNPATSEFFIDLGEIYPEIQVEIFDMTGKKVFVEERRETEKLSISLTEMAKGSYFVKVKSGEKAAIMKLVVI